MIRKISKIKIFKITIILALFFVVNSKYYYTISSPAAVVICENTGRVLYDKNAHQRRPMASLTKLMTAIIFVENCKMDEIIDVDEKACFIGGSEVGLRPNTKITAKDLLYGMLLPSGNDAATQIAIHLSGSVENFAKLMNIRAKEMGLNDTHFVTPHGLDEDKHYTTAFEMALISKCAKQYTQISEAVNTKYTTIQINNGQKQLKNSNALLWDYPYATGMKTGFTDNAGRCLSASASKDNLDLIAVVLGSDSSQIRFNDAKEILEETYQKYKYYDLSKFTNVYINIPIVKGKENEYIKTYTDNLFEALTEEEYNHIYVNVDLIKEIKTPLYQGEKLGKVTISTGNYTIYEKDILLEYNIPKKNTKDYIIYILTHIFDKIERI